MTSARATILIVDDEPRNRKLLETMLRPEGHLTLNAASGEEALASVAHCPPDLILLDIMMPGMDGFQVAVALKGNPATSHIPIIMVTAHSDRGARLAGLDAGAEDFLSKPIDRTELWLRVRNLLRLKALSDFLKELSLQDGLTDLANRRHFDTYLADQVAIARRHKRALALVMCDVDSFKAYNDHYGHQAGDECLKQISAALRSCCRRPADKAARYGGEEFCVILPDTELTGALRIAESARDAVARLKIPHAHSPASSFASISGGISILQGASDVTVGQLITAADQALYQAKNQGRNRMVAAQAAQSSPEST